MNGARIFSLQGHKAQSFLPSMGKGEWDAALAAGLCSGMKREWYLAARLKWALDWSVANELEYMLWIEGAGIGSKEKWKIPKGREYIRKMAGLAVAEVADPARYKENQVKAKWMGVHKSQFSRVWGKRYNLLFCLLDDWANSAYGYVMIKQRYQDELDRKSNTGAEKKS